MRCGSSKLARALALPSLLPLCEARRGFFLPRAGFGSLLDQFSTFGSDGPQMQVRELTDSVVIELEVPRFKPEHIKLSKDAQRGLLTIEGRRASPRATADDMWDSLVFSDAPTNAFQRSLYVPLKHYDLDQAATKIEDGVLSVTIPKREATALPAEKAVTPRETAKSEGSPKEPATPQEATSEKPSAKAAPGGSQVAECPQGDVAAPMQWPPRIVVDDKADVVAYTCSMPSTVKPEDVTLELRGNVLSFRVAHEERTSTKDDDGVEFEASQSVSYQTPLIVPRGTTPNDVVTAFKNGELVITVAKHKKSGEHTQRIPVTSP